MPGGTVDNRRNRRGRSRTRSLRRGAGVPRLRGSPGALGPARWRNVRRAGGEERRRARRSRCVGCSATHVLIRCDSFVRRRDLAEVIGAALVAKASGIGHRRAAQAAGVPASTVRGWFRRFAANAEAIRVWFTVLAHGLDPMLAPVAPTGTSFGDAVEAVAVAARRRRCASPPSLPGRSPRRRAVGGCSPTPVAPGRRPFERPSSRPSSPEVPGGPMQDRRRDVALFRYSLIREAADPALSKAELGVVGGRAHGFGLQRLFPVEGVVVDGGPAGDVKMLVRSSVQQLSRTCRLRLVKGNERQKPGNVASMGFSIFVRADERRNLRHQRLDPFAVVRFDQ